MPKNPAEIFPSQRMFAQVRFSRALFNLNDLCLGAVIVEDLIGEDRHGGQGNGKREKLKPKVESLLECATSLKMLQSMSVPRYRAVNVCGLSAVLACFRKRTRAIRQLWFSPEFSRPLDELCQWMAGERLPFVRADRRELARVTQHEAHGGVVAFTMRPEPALVKHADYGEWQAEGASLVVLDDVADPLQIGAIARVSVAMGVRRLLLGGRSVEAAYNERAWSTAYGALDELALNDAGELPPLLRSLGRHFCIVGFTRPGGRRVDELKPIRVPGRPLAIVLGDSLGGVGSSVVGKCEHLLHIPGVAGSSLFNAADTAAFGLPWLLRKERKPAGFLARKREREAARTLCGA